LLGLEVNASLREDVSDTSSTLTTLSQGDDARTTVINTPCIPLTLADWEKRATIDVPADKSKTQARQLIQYFVNCGLNHLSQDGSHPITILRDPLRDIDDANAPKYLRQERRIAYREPLFKYTQMLRDFVYNKIPVFIMWDTIALIYSVSIEDVFCDREAEFCYQLKLISQALKKTDWFSSGSYFPATTQAAWTTIPESDRLLVAFGFSVASGKNGGLQGEQIPARTNYNNELYKLVTLSDEELGNLDDASGKNRIGNCPEYSTWATLCQGPGHFKSFCLFHLPHLMKCCGPCATTAKEAIKKEPSSRACGRTQTTITPHASSYNESNGACRGHQQHKADIA
jgi:hypothetical protein